VACGILKIPINDVPVTHMHFGISITHVMTHPLPKRFCKKVNMGCLSFSNLLLIFWTKTHAHFHVHGFICPFEKRRNRRCIVIGVITRIGIGISLVCFLVASILLTAGTVKQFVIRKGHIVEIWSWDRDWARKSVSTIDDDFFGDGLMDSDIQIRMTF
jgi:hypothetical protein